jgi:sugar O-acyltransferase (sialic acid O-acetyltransferase NeuD family)
MSIQKVAIIGGKGTALNIAEAITTSSTLSRSNLEVAGFVNDFPDISKDLAGYKVISSIGNLDEFLRKEKAMKLIFALYKPELIEQRYKLLLSMNIPLQRFVTFIHPTAYVSPSAILEPGVIILANCTIQAQVRVGRNSIINSNCVLEHNCEVGSGSFISAGCTVGSYTFLSENVFIGMNTVLRGNLTLEKGTFLGMGSNLTKSVATKNTLLYGNPAREIR